MIEELLLDIVKTEDEWENRVRESAVTSKDIVSAARAQVIIIEKSCNAKIKQIDADNVANAEAVAKVKCDEILLVAANDAANIISEAQKNSPKVIADIISKLEEKYA